MSGLGYREQGHTPAPKEGCHLDNCRLVSLFRDPKQRSASWFYFSKFSKVCLKGSQGNIDEVKACFKLHVDTLYNKPIENLSNRSKSKFDKIDLWGCQSKMMLGKKSFFHHLLSSFFFHKLFFCYVFSVSYQVLALV